MLRFWCVKSRIISGQRSDFMVYSSFPRRTASTVNLRLNMVKHIGQSVFYHSSPAHVTHLKQTPRGLDIRGSVVSSKMLFQRRKQKWHLCLTGWYFTSLGGCLKWGPKLTDTYKKTQAILNNKNENVNSTKSINLMYVLTVQLL